MKLLLVVDTLQDYRHECELEHRVLLLVTALRSLNLFECCVQNVELAID